jgi:hypothetical protein
LGDFSRTHLVTLPVAEVLGLGFYLINQKLKPDRAWVFG